MPRQQNIHVLIAENETHLLESMRFLFETKGYTVTHTQSGTDALHAVLAYHNQDNPIDLLITDIQLPGMSGEELTAAIRQFDKSLPVLVMTGIGFKEQAIRLLQLGCSDYIDKPFGPGQIVKHVEHLLRCVGKNKCLINPSKLKTGEY